MLNESVILLICDIKMYIIIHHISDIFNNLKNGEIRPYTIVIVI